MQNLSIDPGTLNHRFKLQRGTENSDGMGGMSVTWTDVAHVWGSLVPVKNLSREIAQQLEEQNRHHITIRFRSDVSSGWRFNLGERFFVIKSVSDIHENKRYLLCETQEQGR